MSTLYPIQPQATTPISPNRTPYPMIEARMPFNPMPVRSFQPGFPPTLDQYVGATSPTPVTGATTQGQRESTSPSQTPRTNPTQRTLIRNGLTGATIAGGIGALIGATAGDKNGGVEPGTSRQYYDKEKDRKLEIIPRQQKANGHLEIDRIIERDPKDGKPKAEIHYGRETESLVNTKWGNASNGKNGKRMARVVLNDVNIEALYAQHDSKMDLTHVQLPKGQQITADDARTITNTVPTLEDSIKSYETKAEAAKKNKNPLTRWFKQDIEHLDSGDLADYRELNRLQTFKDQLDAESLQHLKNLVDTRANIELPDAETLLAKSVGANSEGTWKAMAKNVAAKGAIGGLIGAALGVGATIASKTLVAKNPSKTLSPNTQPMQLNTLQRPATQPYYS
jgi:hypothetical protein